MELMTLQKQSSLPKKNRVAMKHFQSITNSWHANRALMRKKVQSRSQFSQLATHSEYHSFPPGLLFHRVITYFAKLRSRRRQYHKGLKQLGEHMHVVTRTMSTPPPSNPSTPAGTPVSTPAIAMRKLAAINSNNAKAAKKSLIHPSKNSKIPDDDNRVFKPSTHVMRREDSDLGVMTTATELRHKQEIEELHCIEELHSRE